MIGWLLDLLFWGDWFEIVGWYTAVIIAIGAVLLANESRIQREHRERKEFEQAANLAIDLTGGLR
jgi:hypothetical protein